jgi:squalene cyclase
MVIHLILLLILAFISTPAGNSIGTLLLSIGQSVRDSPVEFAEFEISTDNVLNDSEVLEEVEAEIDFDSLFEDSDLTDIEDVVPVEVGEGALELVQPMFNGRSGATKAALLARFGGTLKTQDAVKRGLEWLKRNQTKDGSWSMRGPYNDAGFTENKTAATAMALLAFLGDGHTHMKGDYQKVVERGMKWLVKQQDRQGFFAKDARSHEKMYAQAQATIAICELYGMTRDSWLRPHAQLAINFAEKAQSEAGGWRYEPKFDSDTSMTGWYVMALESGRAAKLEVNISVLTRVMLYLDDAASYDGAAYGYQARTDPSSAMTAEGLLCRQYIGWKRDHPPLVRGVSALLQDAPFDMADQDVYYWYYATQVLHHFGGSPWRRWNNVMKEELPKAQVKTGRESGSWAPQRDRWGKNAGRLYTTCLSIYCLEVYYRHMPIYDAAAPPGE